MECLVGCVRGQVNPKLDSPCVPEINQFDYSSLDKLRITYGGEGKNTEVWTGPACLLAFGFFLFIVSVAWSFCICCDKFGIFNLPTPIQSYDRQIKEENIEDDFQFI